MKNLSMFEKSPIRIHVVFILSIIAIMVVATRNHGQSTGIPESLFWQQKIKSNTRTDIVILGDSRSYRSIHPNTIQAYTPSHHSAFNFGFSSQGFTSEYLKAGYKKLSKPQKSKIILLGITPHSLTQKATNSNGFSAQKVKENRLKSSMYIRRWAEGTVGNHYWVQSFAQAFQPVPLRNFIGSVIPNTMSRYYNRYHQSGWVESAQEHPNSQASINAYKTIFKENKVTESATQSILTSTATWSSKGVIVVGVRCPAIKKIMEYENKHSGYIELSFPERFKKSGGHWIETLQQYEYYDGNHMNKKNAILFSRDIGKQLRDILESSRH